MFVNLFKENNIRARAFGFNTNNAKVRYKNDLASSELEFKYVSRSTRHNVLADADSININYDYMESSSYTKTNNGVGDYLNLYIK